MAKHEVTFKAELDLVGVPDELIQEAVQAIRTGVVVDPNTPANNVEARGGIIFCDFSMTTDAIDEQDAIAKVKQYLDEQIAGASEITPWKIHGFKAKEAI